MRIKNLLLVTTLLIMCAANIGCSTVESGHVGVKVYLLGGSKGVDSEVLGVGRYWIGWNEDLFLFPTFQQTAIWTQSKTEGSPNDDSFTFQTKKGLAVNADVSISYAIDPSKVSLLFQKYRKGVNEITHIYLRNVVRDALVQVASTKGVEYIYGEGKSDMIAEVKDRVVQQMSPIGIIIDYVSFVGTLRLPQNVVESINLKIEATQRAQQRENELKETIAVAEKVKAEAEGAAQARIVQAKGDAESKVIQAKADADAILIAAKAQAQANDLINKSITKDLIESKKVDKWDGILPRVSGGATPILDMRGD